jgi:hypothetical protein
LAGGTAVKLGKPWVELGYPMSPVYWAASYYRDYGICLFLVVIAWTCFAAYQASPFSKRSFDEHWLIWSGILLFIIFFLLGSFLGFGAGVVASASHGPIQPL